MTFIIYKDRNKQLRWKLVARNGKKIAASGESFTRRRTVHKSIVLFCDAAMSPVIDTTIRKK